MKVRKRIPIPSLAILMLACGAPLMAATPAATAAPAAVAINEPNAAGDIPDTQAFVRYNAHEGYSVLVPEGWSRTVKGSSTTFTSHYDGVRIDVGPRTRTGHRTFTSQSAPDPVTGKTVQLDDEVYVFVKGSRQATLHLWAPHGADNADQWRKIAQSFRW